VSKRPNIASKHEKGVEWRLQKTRRQDQKAAQSRRAESVRNRPVPEPEILSVSRGPVDGPVPAKVKRWIESESAQQTRHYRRISREMDRLEPDRKRWVKEFFARITGPRGFSVHAGTRRTISKQDIPKRPRRPWRVVW